MRFAPRIIPLALKVAEIYSLEVLTIGAPIVKIREKKVPPLRFFPLFSDTDYRLRQKCHLAMSIVIYSQILRPNLHVIRLAKMPPRHTHTYLLSYFQPVRY